MGSVSQIVRRTLHWTGVKRDGTAAGGCTNHETPAELAQRLYDQRYREASITVEAEEVGGVGPDLDRTRRRTWWGEA
jgi:hypothetical protein